jgi:hypothetical protein
MSERGHSRTGHVAFLSRAPGVASQKPDLARQSQIWLIRALGGWLVEADDVSCGIAEAGGDFGGVGADGLDDFAAVSYDRVHRCGYAAYHDVNEEAGFCRGRATEDPSAVDFADGVVKGSAAIAAFADGPAEDLFLEVGGAGDVGGGHFDIADFSVCKGGRHQESFRVAAILAPVAAAPG